MSDKDLKAQIEELKQINKDLETQLHQLYKEKDADSAAELSTEYQENMDNQSSN